MALVFADLAAALAARLARASPRFGPEPATPFAWSDAGVRGTLAALVDGGDADECEAVVAGMLAAEVPVAEIAAGLAEGTARTSAARGRWSCWSAPCGWRTSSAPTPPAWCCRSRRTAAPRAARCRTPSPSRPTRWPGTAHAARGRARVRPGAAAVPVRSDDEPDGTGSLLGCGLALAHAAAAEWAIGLTGVAAASLLHARALAGVYAGAAAEATGEPVDHDDATIAAAVAAGPAQTPRGIAVCLAAAGAALARPDATVRAGVVRLLETPRRERFTARELQPGFVTI